MNRALLRTLLALVLLLSVLQAVAQEQPVGRMNRTYVDDSRQSWDSTGSRPLNTTIWYPAAQGTPQQARTVEIWRFGSSELNAPFADQEMLPLILVSHGVGGTAAQMTWLAERLVRQGYVVAGVNHHGNTAVEDSVLIHGVVLPAERAFDLSALLDRLLEDPDLSALIDPDRVGAAGFSFGGFTVLAAAGMTLDYEAWWDYCSDAPQDAMCTVPPEADFSLADVDSLRTSDPHFAQSVRRNSERAADERIRAVFAIAPALLTRSELSGLQVPAAVILADEDDQVPLEPSLAVLQQAPQIQVTAVNAAHYTFLSPCTTMGRWFAGEVCRDPAGVDREAVHDLVSDQATGFFDSHLRVP